jgi:hypothetical protein
VEPSVREVVLGACPPSPSASPPTAGVESLVEEGRAVHSCFNGLMGVCVVVLVAVVLVYNINASADCFM